MLNKNNNYTEQLKLKKMKKTNMDKINKKLSPQRIYLIRNVSKYRQPEKNKSNAESSSKTLLINLTPALSTYLVCS